MNTYKLYDKDFYAWTVEMASALKNKTLDQLDFEHLAEELEGMSARELREIRSRLIILIMHLLKWEYQPLKQSSGWKSTIFQQRYELQDVLEQSPSLKNKLQSELSKPRIYKKSVVDASIETGLLQSSFPSDLPYTISQLLDDEFYPT